ncbi:MAG TPA: hypothetical protein VMD29_12640, partial [Terracidiphilus sp.]|nr:hypothetical protein [Terracidiphilus sp.]
MKYAAAKTSLLACLALIALPACLLSPPMQAQTAPPVITLDPPTGWELQAHLFDGNGKRLPEGPANFRRLGEARTGQLADLHTLTLRFSETAKLTGIQSTKDFRIEQGGSCVEGNVYQKGSTCRLLVRFTPQGAGRRTGRIDVSYAGASSPVPMVLSGFSYEPVISFIPAVIATIPASYPSKVGLLNGAHNLDIDGGDTLYVADTGNNAVRMMDSSGKFTTLDNTSAAPWGVAADSFGEVWFSEPSKNEIWWISAYGAVYLGSGSGDDACIYTSSPICKLAAESVYDAGTINFDANDTMFFEELVDGAAWSQRWASGGPNFVRLHAPFVYQTAYPGGFAIDANDNLYSSWTTAGSCQINRQSLYPAEQLIDDFVKVAGGHVCGYSGDGGLANNAEISSTIGQIAFDPAGDMYFADAGNQRVRRVELGTSKVIRDVAGNGTAGYTGDGGDAQWAELNNPTGVAVDSQGAVYVISNS